MNDMMLRRLFWRARIIKRMKEAGESMADIAMGFGLSDRRQAYGIMTNARDWLTVPRGKRFWRAMPLDEQLRDMMREANDAQLRVYQRIGRAVTHKLNSRGFSMNITTERRPTQEQNT